MRRLAFSVVALPLFAAAAGAQTGLAPSLGVEPMDAAEAYPTARLQGLDKVTARISTFETPIDVPAEFGSLEIRVRSCWKNPPEETPESAAYLEIRDHLADSDEPVFAGWMYASSPAINALEHPVYDVWVLDCLPAEGAGGASDPEPDAGPGPGQDAPPEG